LSELSNLPTLWNGSQSAENLLILAHGAGAPMDTEFMNFFAEKLAKANIKVLRFEFPYMALRRRGHGRRPPNTQKILLSSWRDIITECRKIHSGSIFIGGKSMGGRMASMVADECGVAGLIVLGYPFYAPSKQDKPRIEHLLKLKTPSLILQGERDPMGAREIVESYNLSEEIKIIWLGDGNHDLKPRKKSGITEQENFQRALNEISSAINISS